MTETDEAATAFEFPCTFPLKAIGRDVDDFEAFVVAMVQKHAPGQVDLPVARRLSHGGKYLAVTVTFVADSKAQLDALYIELNQSQRVLMTL